MQRVHRPRQRDLGPVEPRRPHVDAARGRRAAPRRAGRRRWCGSTWMRRPVSRASRSTTQRVALPQAPASAPSGLRMRMKASALELGGGGSMAMNWSQPMPVRRSAIAAARRGVRPSGPARSSNTTKSLPQPCILRKRAMGRVYAAVGGWGEGDGVVRRLDVARRGWSSASRHVALAIANADSCPTDGAHVRLLTLVSLSWATTPAMERKAQF